MALTPVQCIHYALTRPAAASVMVGVTTLEHVDDALAYEQSSEEERDYASVLAGAPRHAYYGQCTYCGHCTPCVSGINIALVNKFYDLAVMRRWARRHLRVLRARNARLVVLSACLLPSAWRRPKSCSGASAGLRFGIGLSVFGYCGPTMRAGVARSGAMRGHDERRVRLLA